MEIISEWIFLYMYCKSTVRFVVYIPLLTTPKQVLLHQTPKNTNIL